MTRTKNVCEAMQQRGWKSERLYRLWVAGGAVRGVLLHQNDAIADGLSAGLAGAEGGLVLLVVLLPFMLWSLFKNRQQNRQRKALTKELDELDPSSREFLTWDERNFLLVPSQIKNVVFSGKGGAAWSSRNFQRMQVELPDGQSWRFTFASRLDANRLEEALRGEGFVVSRLGAN